MGLAGVNHRLSSGNFTKLTTAFRPHEQSRWHVSKKFLDGKERGWNGAWNGAEHPQPIQAFDIVR
jgi:hypothetical protein